MSSDIRGKRVAAARAHGFAQIISMIGPDRKRIDPDDPERQRRSDEWVKRRSTYASDVVTVPGLLLPTAQSDEERSYLMARHEQDSAAYDRLLAAEDRADYDPDRDMR